MKHSRSMDAGMLSRALLRPASMLAVVTVLGLTCAAVAQETVVINFDELAIGVHPGNIYLDHGVRITTCETPNDITVGGTLTATDLQPWFEIWQWGWAVSEPNYLLALNVGTHDILLNFTVPVTSVGLDLDLYPFEVPNVVRLVALQSSGDNNYKVLKYAQATDEVSVPPATHMSIDLGGTAFSAVLFQMLDELEGMDNLTFQTTGPIPTPPDEGSPGPPPAGSGGWAGGGGSGGDVEPPSTDNANASGGDNDNKTPESPSTGDQSSANGNAEGSELNVNQSGTQTNANSGGSSPTASAGGCAAPVAVVMLCLMLLLRLLTHGGSAQRNT